MVQVAVPEIGIFCYGHGDSLHQELHLLTLQMIDILFCFFLSRSLPSYRLRK